MYLSNEALFYKAAKGDLKAFEKFISNYEKLIYNAAYRMFPNGPDAEDISQEVLIKVYKNLSFCKSPMAFKSWLFKIISNTCIDEMRKRKGKQTYSLDERLETDSGSLENQLLIDEATPETHFFRKEDGALIQAAISKLSPDYRMIIVLRDINGLSYDEISEVLGINIGTVKSRLSRARNVLRIELLNIREQSG